VQIHGVSDIHKDPGDYTEQITCTASVPYGTHLFPEFRSLTCHAYECTRV
jgi:hypothetical protein